MLLIAMALALIALWTSAAYLVYFERQRLIAERSGHLERATTAIAAQTEQLFALVEVFFSLADQWFALHAKNDPRFDGDFHRFITEFEAHTGGRINIRFNSSEGGLFIPPSVSTTPLGDMSDRDFFIAANAAKTPTMFIGAPMFTKVMQRWIVPLSYPLRSRPHGISVITAAIPFAVMEDIYEAARDKPGGSISLLRRDGVLLARAPRIEAMIGKSLAGGKVLAKLLAQSERGVGVEQHGQVDGRSRIFAYSQVAGFPLVVVATADMADVLQPLVAYAWQVVAWAALMSLAVLVIGRRALRDLVELAQTRQALSVEARTDALTGVANRRSFMPQAEDELARAQRYKRDLAILMLDLDHFKQINDRFGHRRGDQVLQRAAAATQSVLRSSDLLARYGGEEFVVLMPETAASEATKVALRIQEAIRAIAIVDGQDTITVRASIGVASLLGTDTRVESLLQRADEALYTAKHQGRDRVVYGGEAFAGASAP